jgi:hypothetical protein
MPRSAAAGEADVRNAIIDVQTSGRAESSLCGLRYSRRRHSSLCICSVRVKTKHKDLPTIKTSAPSSNSPLSFIWHLVLRAKATQAQVLPPPGGPEISKTIPGDSPALRLPFGSPSANDEMSLSRELQPVLNTGASTELLSSSLTVFA